MQTLSGLRYSSGSWLLASCSTVGLSTNQQLHLLLGCFQRRHGKVVIHILQIHVVHLATFYYNCYYYNYKYHYKYYH